MIEQASHLVFAGGEVATYNDQICILHPFPCDLTFSVKGEEFTKILNGMSVTEFDMDLSSEGTLKISAKKTKAELSTIVGDESKVEHLIQKLRDIVSKDNFFKPLPKEFLEGIFLCAFSANKDIATGVRSCIAVKGDAIYSTDNIRASNYIMESSMDDMLLPAKDAMELVKYKVEAYGISENWLHFCTKDGIVFNCKTMKGEYPFKKVQSIFADVDPELEFPTDLRECVSSVTILAEGDLDVSKMVRVSIDSESITVKAEKERGWIEKSVDFKYEGDKFSFIINPIFFAQILQHATGFVLVNNLAQFSSDNFYHVLALPTEG